MIKFIKRQFARSWNLIRAFLGFMFFDTIRDEFLGLTTIGKYVVGIFLGIICGLATIILIVFTPIMLVIFKDDEEVGF